MNRVDTQASDIFFNLRHPNLDALFWNIRGDDHPHDNVIRDALLRDAAEWVEYDIFKNYTAQQLVDDFMARM